MRKRKPPVLLVTMLVLMLTAVGIIYAPRAAAGDGHDHGQQAANTPPPPAAETGDRPKVSASQVATMAKGGIGAPEKGRPGPTGMPGPGTAPSIAAVKPMSYKPTPNESSTSTQWYTDQTKK